MFKFVKNMRNKMTQCNTVPLISDTPSTVLEKCSIDIVGPFCPSKSKHRYILTVQNDLSKFLIAVPLEDQSAEQVAKAFVDHVLICGWFEKSVRSQKVGTTRAYQCYFKLVVYLRGTRTKCQPNRSITLFGVRLNRKSCDFQKNGRKRILCWSNITL
jgi:hypothetical protein